MPNQGLLINYICVDLKIITIIFGQPSTRNHGKKPKESVHLIPLYVNPNQITIEGFQTPFDQQLAKDNRWVVLDHLIPWHEVCSIYLKHVGVSSTGRSWLREREQRQGDFWLAQRNKRITKLIFNKRPGYHFWWPGLFVYVSLCLLYNGSKLHWVHLWPYYRWS